MIATKPEPFSETAKAPPLWKQFLAFFLGLLSVFLGFFLNEAFGWPAAFIGMAVFFFIGQFLLSRGQSHAFLESWHLVAAMNCTLLCIVFVLGQVEMVCLLVVAMVSSYAGVALAAITAAHSDSHRRFIRRRSSR